MSHWYLRLLMLLLFVFPVASLAADNAVPAWERVDESADLAELAEHANERMRFKLLNSRLLDKNDLWAPFTEALAGFSAADYERLRPLIIDQSIAAIQQAVADGLLTYEALATFYIYRIREIESDNDLFINAVIALNPDAITRAQRLDQLRQRGNEQNLDSIFGIPVLLKDNIGFQGLPTTAGAVALANNYTSNAFITDQLRAKGAIILGKANLSEWAYFFCDDCPSGYSAMGGQTLNPYGRKLFGTGGSSSGSGASVAANLATVAVGSETSGSILSPASANSLVGLKPTTGSLSRSGVVPISATLDTTGPLTRSVADAVSLFNAMTGYDQADMAMPLISEDFSLIYRQPSLEGKRIGVLNSYTDNGFYVQAASLLATNGGSTIEVDFTAANSARFSEFLGAEMVHNIPRYLAQYASEEVTISSIADLQAFNEEAPELRAPYAQALVDMMAELDMSVDELASFREELQLAARSQLDQLFSDFDLDVLLSINNRNAGLAALANYPALTIPMGYEEDGRPIGLTLIAPAFREQDLIDVGANFEQLSHSRRTPELYP